MYRVGIIGAEASGKSTLARYLSNRYKGVLVPEHARAYVEAERERRQATTAVDISYEQLCHIAQHQIKELESLSTLSQDQVVFFDTELIVTKVWFDYAFGRIPKWLEQAIEQYPMDVYLLTYHDLPWVQDGARYNGSDAMRMELFERYEREIQALNIPYYIIRHCS